MAQPILRVNELATSGYLNTKDFETAVNSLFVESPEDAIGVFGSLDNLRSGLETLIQLIETPKDSKNNRQLLNYCLGVLHLQKRLSRDKNMLSQVATRLDGCKHQVEHFGPTHDNVIANLADAYSNTISTFQFRIQVMGEHQYLQQKRVADQVRVLLFAGVRASMLWRQMGGSRWHLLLQRSKILDSAKHLLQQCSHLE